MKNKLLKRLTTLVVSVAMIATMVTGFSTDVYATISGDTVTYNGSGKLTTSIMNAESDDYWGITKIVVEGYNEIDEDAFMTGSWGGNQIYVTSVILQDVTKVGASAFDNCRKLANLSMDNVTSIGFGAFAVINGDGTTPVDINLPNIESIGANAFEFGKIGSVTIGKNCTIGSNAFKNVGAGVAVENRPVLNLPDDWTGTVPDSDGKWYGGYFKYTAPTPPAPPTPDPTPSPSKDEKKEEPAKEKPVDHDTFKSEAPYGTVGVTNNNSKIGDLKVHKVTATTEANQTILANDFAKKAGKRARILTTASVHPRRDLGADNGKMEALIWNNLEKKVQPVYAVCYNQKDGAYFISGTLDANGTARLNNFVLRDATNVTIFVLE